MESLSAAKIYMHCTHATAHSMTLSSTLTAWLKAQAGLKDLAQVTDKKADRVHTGLT